MDNDGIDDILTLDDGRNLHVLYSDGVGGFTDVSYGQISGSNQWGFAAADMNNDGHVDVISGGSYDGVHYVSIDAPGVYSSTNLSNGSMFMQGCNIADVDNDGLLDYFACHDDAASRIWRNDGAGGLIPNTALIDFTNYDNGGYTNTDHSGNYGSVWTDFDDDGDLDLYIAKCRQFVSDPNDPRRINQLWVNDGNGNYTEAAASHGLVFLEQSWTADFADYDNDGDMDCLITNHSTNMMLLENDGSGNFSDVSAAAGVDISGFFLQAKMVDFDNDGFNDIIYAGGVHGYFHNNGDGTFSSVASTFPYGDTMHSFGIGDLNKDGFLDVYASYGNVYVSSDNNNPDILWENDGNANNWVAFDLQGFQSNMSAVGAKVKIYGSWGVQVREVRAGESYGIVNTFHAHFGLGSATSIDSTVIEWPSGITTTITDPAVNSFNNVLEASCQLTGITISADGPTEICPGESVTLSAPAGYTYQWNNGEQTQDIVVNANGSYSVTVTDGGGCIGSSQSLAVQVLTPTQATLSSDNATVFCEGGSVTLTASAGASYVWSNGETTQSILATTAGTYFVDVTDVCGNVSTSDALAITTLNSPPTPMVADVELAAPGSADLFWNGENVQWYDAIDALTPLATGDNFTTPVVSDVQTFWLDDFAVNGGTPFSGGKTSYDANNGQYHTNSGYWLLFDANEDIYLDSVKVYAGNTGDRTIEVIDELGASVVSLTVSIPAGESYVPLGFFIPQGTGYGLRTTDNNPQLWREAPPATMSYPYEIGTLATITSSSIVGANATAYYYFFYDWHVSTESTICTTERVAVTVTVAAGVEGCTDPGACNFDPAANTDDGSCDYVSCLGCTDMLACNYDASALIEDGSCTYQITWFADLDNDGAGDPNNALGFCSDPGAGWSITNNDCDDENSNVYPGAPGTAEGIDNNCNGVIDPQEEVPADCPGDFDNDGLITTSDLLVVLGDYGCLSNCTADLDNDGIVSTSDILQFLSAYGTSCQ